jgi:nucleoside-diphosphate-sugar epimerase
MIMRCLITGVAGFIGSHLAERLLSDGHEVCGVDAFIDYYPRAMKERNLEVARSWNSFTFIEDDLLTMRVIPLLDGVDWVFHQAAQAGVRASWGKEFARYTGCNVLVTQRLLEAALYTNSIRRFIYASSSSVYGDAVELPLVEDTLLSPLSPYGVTKLAAENLCTLYHRNFDVPTVSLRYFTVYGPRQRPDMAFHRFCKAVINGEPVRVFGDGYQTRDFTYVSDIVEANLQAATSVQAVGQVMNIAGGSRVTVRHVVELMSAISKSRVEVIYSEKEFGDVRHTLADTSRAERLLRYCPRVTLQEGLAQEYAYVQDLYERV